MWAIQINMKLHEMHIDAWQVRLSTGMHLYHQDAPVMAWHSVDNAFATIEYLNGELFTMFKAMKEVRYIYAFC